MAQIAIGDTVSVEEPVGSGTYVALAEVTRVDTPKLSLEAVDVTHHGSGGVREFEPGVGQYNGITCEMNHEPNSATDQLIGTMQGAREIRSWQISTSGVTYTFLAFVGDYTVSGSLGEKRTATLTLNYARGGVTVA